MVRRGPGLALLVSAAVLTWAHLAIASLTVCLNESPELATQLAQAVPAIDAAARWLLPLFAPLGVSAQSCDPAAPARAMAIAALAFVAAIFVLERGHLSPGLSWPLVIVTSTLMRLALFFMPGLLSSDIIDYATHGRVASLHAANPYVFTPSQFPADPLSSLGAWPKVVTVYGPLWTHVDTLVTGLLPNAGLVQLVFTYKLIALLADLASVGLLLWTARSWRRLGAARVTPVVAVAMWVWNPLVNLELIGNAHNEALMFSLMLLGLALLTLAIQRSAPSWLWLAALVSIWLATLVKFVPAALEASVAFVWLRIAGQPARRLALLLAALIVLTLVVAIPWLDSPAVATPVIGLASGGQRFKDVWQDAPAAWLTVRVVPLLGVPDDPDTLRMDVARVIVWGITRALFVAYLLIEAVQLWRQTCIASQPTPGRLLHAIAAASLRILLLALLLYTSQVYAWYFLWPLPMACLLGPRDASSRAVLVFGLTFMPAFYLREFQPYGVFDVPRYAEIALAILVATWVVSRGLSPKRIGPTAPFGPSASLAPPPPPPRESAAERSEAIRP